MNSNYSEQLQAKQQRINQQFAAMGIPALEVFASQPEHYRMRAEFRVWHDGDDLYHIMFDQQSKQKYRVDQFAAASSLINTMMMELLPLLKSNTLLRRKLFQVEYLSTTQNEVLITLLYHKPLDEEWQAAAEQLKETLQSHAKVHILGRARKQKILLHQDFVTETLNIDGRSFQFQQVENSFTQPNAGINSQMISWALSLKQDKSSDLLELYCGNGNFSLPLAQHYRRVLGTEIAKSSVTSAQHNIALNQIDNVDIVRLSSEEFTEAMTGKRQFQRLGDVVLADYQFDTILVDPPRAGLDPATLALTRQFQNIIYISCNPDTLHNNLEQLMPSHEIQRFALFDQFPYTHHIESGVFLSKR